MYVTSFKCSPEKKGRKKKKKKRKKKKKKKKKKIWFRPKKKNPSNIPDSTNKIYQNSYKNNFFWKHLLIIARKKKNE